MDKHMSAQQLWHLIDAVSDEDMIDCYINCSCCVEKQVTPQQLEMEVALFGGDLAAWLA